MKKWIVITALCFAMLGLALPTQAKNVNLTFEWEQPQPMTSNFYGWKLWVSNTHGGPYTQFGTDIVYDGSPNPKYTASEDLTAPDGAETMFYFVINSWDNGGNHSADSNEVSFLADFLPPGVPVQFTVTVTPSP